MIGGGDVGLTTAARLLGLRAAQTVMDGLVGRDQAQFEFTCSFRCVSLGKEDGLIQFVDAQDIPVEQI